jgi:hypothetical protein
MLANGMCEVTVISSHSNPRKIIITKNNNNQKQIKMRTDEFTPEDYKRKLTLTLNHAQVKSLINLLDDTYSGMLGYHNLKVYIKEELENNIEFEEMCDEVDDEYLQGLIDEDTYQQSPAYERLMKNSDLRYE